MGRNKKKSLVINRGRPPPFSIHGRKISRQDRDLFHHRERKPDCLIRPGQQYLEIHPLDRKHIWDVLNNSCDTIEHQFIALRKCVQLTNEDYRRRYMFTQCLLTCLYRHHNVVYQGILFGSTVNGLGFRDSDIDLRLRPLRQVDPQGTYEPVTLDEDMVDRILRNIAHQTTKCSPAFGEFVPSSRCPIAKLIFVKPDTVKNNPPEDSLKYDISLSTSNPLSSFNSLLLRFLCDLEPKFHLLATVLRYWSVQHDLIIPGHLSSYALVNMLIHFCQAIEPPLLPTIDKMRDLYFEKCLDEEDGTKPSGRGLTKLEWQCLVCFRKEFYKPSKNTEPLCVLLLKFFEFYLKFPYSTHIITARTGRALDHKEFSQSNQYDRRFRIKQFINIQDPFDLKHNLTAGMQGRYFKYFMITLRYSYERLFQELLNNFSKGFMQKKRQSWGLNVLFTDLSDKELNAAS